MALIRACGVSLSLVDRVITSLVVHGRSGEIGPLVLHVAISSVADSDTYLFEAIGLGE